MRHRARLAGDTRHGPSQMVVPTRCHGGRAPHCDPATHNPQPDQAVFVFIGNTLPKSSDSMEDVYDTHRHRDTGLLFIQYSLERTYG